MFRIDIFVTVIFFLFIDVSGESIISSSDGSSMFVEQMPNVTVPTGREAIFTCVIDNVENFKVAFLRVDTQTILTIDETIITRSARVTVRHSIDKDENLSTRLRKTWQLSLKDVSPADNGAYMCQLNIEPMVNQVAYLHVTVPPDILVNISSSDLTVTEGENATLKCSAIGYPEPNITWRREDYQPIYINQTGVMSGVVEGSVLNLVAIHRRQMAAYLCIASNGIPPPVSKRILLRVEFPPDITTHQVDVVVQRMGEPLMLHCQCQSWPLGSTSWTLNDNHLPPEREAFDYRTQVGPTVIDMYLNIPDMQLHDEGNYTCHCSNSRGTANRSITVKGIPLDPVQQKRMAWSGQEKEEDEDDFSSPLPPTEGTTTTVSIRPITVAEERPLQMSTTDLTTSKTMDGANHPTEEPKRTIGPLLQRKKTGMPTSFTSKAGLISAWSIGRYLCLLSFIMFLIDNHPAA